MLFPVDIVSFSGERKELGKFLLPISTSEYQNILPLSKKRSDPKETLDYSIENNKIESKK